MLYSYSYFHQQSLFILKVSVILTSTDVHVKSKTDIVTNVSMEYSAFETSVQFAGQVNVTSLNFPCTLNITVGMVVIHEKLEE